MQAWKSYDQNKDLTGVCNMTFIFPVYPDKWKGFVHVIQNIHTIC